ncbi:MAG: hypothetical protein IT379_26570, partial [Deltaproteobacteria bacterium]|nr:hypothetical protein [Deltaproteobacteria bacterium]
MHAEHDPFALHGSVVPPPPHSLETQLQSPQLPDVGPLLVPETHEKLDSHQPQPVRKVQSPQVALDPQMSLIPPPHSLDSQLQSPQLPDVGPLALPAVHAAVLSQKPQPLRTVQASQSALEPHASVPPPEQSDEIQSQSAHEPTVGPVVDPPTQLFVDAHQPQPDRRVHSPHVPLVAHMSVLPPPLHSLESHAQSPHVPLVGPVVLPETHWLLVEHQPQPGRTVHASHVVLVLQSSPPDVVHSLDSQTQSPQVPPVGPVEVPSWQSPPAPALHQPQP